jgi:hypothetical protein
MSCHDDLVIHGPFSGTPTCRRLGRLAVRTVVWSSDQIYSGVRRRLPFLHDATLKSHADEAIAILASHPAQAHLDTPELVSEVMPLLLSTVPLCITHLTNPRKLAVEHLLHWPHFDNLFTHPPTRCTLTACHTLGCRQYQFVQFLAQQPDVTSLTAPVPFFVLDLKFMEEADISDLVRQELAEGRACAVSGSQQEAIPWDSDTLRALVGDYEKSLEYLGNGLIIRQFMRANHDGRLPLRRRTRCARP